MTTEAPARRARRRRVPATDGHEREQGYTMIMTALLLIPLLAFAGLAVDVGGWYARGTQLQRAADAAALAGATMMPDFNAAQAEAITTARKNGFVNGGSISITVTQKDERRIGVTIEDTNVQRYFSSLFMSTMSITRSATAEFVLPVPLGSPENYFGNDPVNPPAAGQPGLWGNIHGPETDNQKGDRYSAGCRNASGCSPTANTEYRGYYLYAIDVPAGVGTMSVDVFDAGLYHRATEQTDTGDTDYSAAPTVDDAVSNFQLFGPDTTLLDFLDASAPTSCPGTARGPGSGRFELAEEADPATYLNQWVSLCTITSPTEGERYWLKVWTTGNGDIANRYALRVTSSTAAKPTLFAYRDMSMFNNQLTVNPNFYLAKVDPIHKGKTFLVSLYDPGEINVKDAAMQVIDPTGVVASSCKVSVFNNPTDSSAATITTFSPCSIPTTNADKSAKYGGKLLSIDIKLPSTYSCTTCWWKIRYDLGPSPSGSPADTTTWSAAIKGDPVHLVNE